MDISLIKDEMVALIHGRKQDNALRKMKKAELVQYISSRENEIAPVLVRVSKVLQEVQDSEEIVIEESEMYRSLMNQCDELERIVSEQRKTMDAIKERADKYESLYRQLVSKPKSGRKPVPDEKRQEIEQLRMEGLSIRAIAEATGISRSAVGRIVQEYDKNASKTI